MWWFLYQVRGHGPHRRWRDGWPPSRDGRPVRGAPLPPPRPGAV